MIRIRVACKWCVMPVFLLALSLQLHLCLCSPCFFLRITSILRHILTVLFQVKVTGSGGQANIAWLSGTGLKQKKQPQLLLVDQEGSHVVQLYVTHTEECGKPVMHWTDLFSAVPYGTPHMLLSWATHCPIPMSVSILYGFRAWFEAMPLSVFMMHSSLHAVHNHLSCPEVYVYYKYCMYVCVCECAPGKEGQVLHSGCCQGRQTKKA